MKLLEMVKDMKIKHSISPQSMGDFFLKKSLHGEQTFLDKFIGGCFTWGLIIIQGGEEKLHKCIFQ